MKTAVLIAQCLAFLLIFSCKDAATVAEPGSGVQSGSMMLKFSTPPAGIISVVADLSRSGFSPLTLSMSLSDTGAAGSFDAVPAGRWHMKVDAKDASNIVQYSGETDVDVQPGVTTHVSLQLVPTTGRIEVVVTWGTPSQDDALVLYYPFNGNANDESGKGHHGIVSGADLTTDRTGHLNSAYAFDGVYNHIAFPDIAINPASAITMSAWVKPADLSRRMLCVYLGARSGEAYLQVLKSSFSFGVNLANRDTPQVRSSVVADMNSFTHIVGVYRPGSTIQIWTNGVLAGELPIANSPLMAGIDWLESSVGSYSPASIDYGTQYGYYPWEGVIDQVRIYTRALNQGEIVALYNSGE